MKKNLLTTYLVCLLMMLVGSAAYAGNIVPTTPQWASAPAPYIVFSNTEIALFWQPSSDSIGVAGYYIYRCMGVNCTIPSQPTFNVNNGSSTFYGDDTLTGGASYSYTIAAYDSSGNISEQSTVVTATTYPPVSVIVPAIAVTPANAQVKINQNFTFNMATSSLSTGGTPSSNASYGWNWDFGDGTPTQNGGPGGSSPVTTAVHQYTSSGAYTVTLTVFNTSTGDQSEVQQTVTVLPAVSVTNATLRLPFNGDIVDYSGNQLQVLGVNGMPSFTAGTPCVTGLALTLDGTAGGPYVSVSDNGSGLLDGNTSASLALFVQKNTPTASGTVYVKQGVYSIALASQGLSASLTNANGVTVNLSSSTVSNKDTNWHHYALTYNGTTATLYFDGAVVATQTLGGNLAHAPAADLLLGETIGGNTFNGSLSTVRYYNAALTAPQVGYLYNGTQFGDINAVVDGNGYQVVTIYDAYLAAQNAAGSMSLTTTQQTQGEVSLDSSVSSADALLIAQKAVGSILKFPADLSEE